MNPRVFPIVFLLAVFSQTVFGNPYSLKKAVENAREKRFSVAEKKFDAQLAGQATKQAQKEFYPTVAFTNNNIWRDPLNIGGVAGQFGEGFQTNSTITVDQPLFRGGAAFKGLKIAKTNQKVRKWEARQAELDISVTVSDIFFDALAAQADLQHLTQQRDLLQERVGILSDWVEIGKAKRSELISARSEWAKVRSDIAQAESQLQTLIGNLKYLTGDNSLKQLLVPHQTFSIDEKWLQKVEQQPSILAKKEEIISQDLNIGLSNATYYPNVDVQGNYYLERAGILRDSKWDVNVAVSWELFGGGRTTAEAQFKAIEKRKLESELEEMKQQWTTDIRVQLEYYKNQKKTLALLKETMDLADETYQQQLIEFERGLISNIEVTRTLDALIQAKRAYDRVRFEIQATGAKTHFLAGVDL